MSATQVVGDPDDGDDENSSPPMKRLRTHGEIENSTIASIENRQQDIYTSVQKVGSSGSQTGASLTSAPSTIDANTSPAALSLPSLDGDTTATSGHSVDIREAVTMLGQTTREPSFSVSDSSALFGNYSVTVDFASAPSDPVELALWVAEQIQLFASKGTNSVMEEDEKRRRSLSHAPGAKIREKNDKNLDPEKLSQLQKTREISRTRKANWRKNKDATNKDNDLRCRLYKRAKAIYGEADSEEKIFWIDKEFAKRKAKRTQNEKHHGESSFTGFIVPLDLGAKLFTVANGEFDNQINAAGTLLLNTLHIITSVDDFGPPSNQGAAFALKSALGDPEIGTQSFVQALRILSTDPTIMSAIIMASSRASSKGPSKASSKALSQGPASEVPRNTNLVSGYSSSASSCAPASSSYGGRPAARNEGSASPVAEQLQLRGGIALETNEPPDDNKKLQAINTAVEILKQMADENTLSRLPPFGRPLIPYVTPYETSYQTPYPNVDPTTDQSNKLKRNPSEIANKFQGSKGSGIPDSTTTDKDNHKNDTHDAQMIKGSRKPTESEEAQADLLLRFAGVGSLSDADDDVIELYSVSRPQPDTDVEATLQNIYKVLESRDAIAGSAQAAALRSAIEDIRLAKNHIIPREQSLAIARLYGHLASRSQGASIFAGRTLPPLPVGPLVHRPGSITPQHPGGPFLHPSGSVLPPHAVLIEHPGGVFSSPHYPGGYFVPHPSGFRPPHPSIHGSGHSSNPAILSPPSTSPQARPFIPSSMPPPPVPTRIGTARGKTAEEAKKVRDYGFPPLPGSRPGGNVLGTKGKSGRGHTITFLSSSSDTER